MPQIYPKKIKNQIYYYYQYTYREKVDPALSGKKRGSGKSRVRTISVFLGTAEAIYETLKTGKPTEVAYREFGLIAAGYEAAKQIGLLYALRRHIPGKRYGIFKWIFFLVTIINRLDCATSKEQMGKWASKTILPELLEFNADILNSKTFWYVTDDVISEKEVNKKRLKDPGLNDDLFAGITATVFENIENEIWPQLAGLLGGSIEGLIYDTTNFFTYIKEPASSMLAKSGHNKDSRHSLKQIGLALLVEKVWGMPIFHRLYKGNSHDSKTFSGIITELLKRIKAAITDIEDLVLVIDKGNNSEDNFNKLKGQINWVGSLTTSHYPQLIKKNLSEYSGRYGKYKYYRTDMEIMGMKCAVVVTYNEDLHKKQQYTLQAGIGKLKKKLQEKFDSYKMLPQKLTKGITSLKEADRYGTYVDVAVEDKKLVFTPLRDKMEAKEKFLGKNIIFSDKTDAESGWIIAQYKQKEKVEDDFKVLKSPDIIRFRPVRHWTDTKIYAYGFCCIMALILIKVMQIQADRIGLKMSPAVLKEELKDMKEIIMIYGKDRAEKQISQRSSIQQKLWELFDLMQVEKAVNHTLSA